MQAAHWVLQCWRSALPQGKPKPKPNCNSHPLPGPSTNVEFRFARNIKFRLTGELVERFGEPGQPEYHIQ